jgi:thiosulfate dehydrogenase [quinone] large subunit
MKLANIQILILRLALAGLFLHLGMGKIREGWLTKPDQLSTSLAGFQQKATGYQLTYLNMVAIPYTPVWSRLIAVGETAIGISLLIGMLARFSSLVGLIMVLNLHAATGNLFSLSFFGSPSAALIMAGLLVTFLARAGRWAGLDALLSKTNPRSFFW